MIPLLQSFLLTGNIELKHFEHATQTTKQTLYRASKFKPKGISSVFSGRTEEKTLQKTNFNVNLYASKKNQPLISENPSSRKFDLPSWTVPSEKDGNDKTLVWESISPEEVIKLETTPTKPSVEHVNALLESFPIMEQDYEPILYLSPAVPTASVLQENIWRLEVSNLSPFNSRTGTGNQNYFLNIDFGLANNLMISGFYSQADDPLNAPLKGFATQPANFWESYGASARWMILDKDKWKLAFSGSLEGWGGCKRRKQFF